MDPMLLTWILIAAGIVVIAVIAVVYVSQRPSGEVRALRSAWGEVARRTRLTFTPPQGSLETARLHGTYRTREVAVAVRARTAYAPQGQQIHYYTRLEAYVRNPNRSFIRLTTKGGYRKTDQYLGQPLRPVGVSQIDNRFDIKCIPHDLAERLLPHSDTLRAGLQALDRERYVEIELEGSALRLEEEGIDTQPAYLQALFGLACDFGEAFERLGG